MRVSLSVSFFWRWNENMWNSKVMLAENFALSQSRDYVLNSLADFHQAHLKLCEFRQAN